MEELGHFLASWKLLSISDKNKGIKVFAENLKVKEISRRQRSLAVSSNKQSSSCPLKICDKISLSVKSSYLYYYPTMHWSLNKHPQDDEYWVGIFPSDGSDDDYLTYTYLEDSVEAAQGSYYCGKLDTEPFLQSSKRYDKFELRIFHGNKRLKAETNELRGVVNVFANDPSSPFTPTSLGDLASQMPDTATKAIEDVSANVVPVFSSLEDLNRQWDNFTPGQRQLLFPMLDQASLQEESIIAVPTLAKSSQAEPRIRFSALKDRKLGAARGTGSEPDHIVLTITLTYAYTYVDPVLLVQENPGETTTWMGVYHIEKDLCFDPEDSIGDDKTVISPGEEQLSQIKEYVEGPIEAVYLGVIFDEKKQLGFCRTRIEASISATPALPPASFTLNFDKVQALRYAELSRLAYKPYEEVQSTLPSDYDLQADMEIYDEATDTNGFIASNKESVVVAFRGTTKSSGTDVMTDLNFFSERIDSDVDVYAHAGFVTAYKSVFSSIESKIKPHFGKKTLFIIGHSLGAALASLTTYSIVRKYPDVRPIQYLYGCPPVGDINFATFFKGLNASTITLEGDLVSDGFILTGGEWMNLYKPVEVKYLPEPGDHSSNTYVKHLKELLY